MYLMANVYAWFSIQTRSLFCKGMKNKTKQVKEEKRINEPVTTTTKNAKSNSNKQ